MQAFSIHVCDIETELHGKEYFLSMYLVKVMKSYQHAQFELQCNCSVLHHVAPALHFDPLVDIILLLYLQCTLVTTLHTDIGQT